MALTEAEIRRRFEEARRRAGGDFPGSSSLESSAIQDVRTGSSAQAAAQGRAQRERDRGRSSGGGTVTTTAGSALDIQDAIQDALRDLGIGQGPSLDDLRDLINEMLPPAPPPIDFGAAQGTILEALNPLISSGLSTLNRQFDQGLRALQAQQAMSGILGNPAQRALENFANTRAQAVNALQAETAAQAVNQALNLIGAQQSRFGTQQEANQAARQAAINAFNVLGGLQNQVAQNTIGSILDAFRIQEGARQANLPFELPTQGNLLQFILELLRLNPQAFQDALGQLGG